MCCPGLDKSCLCSIYLGSLPISNSKVPLLISLSTGANICSAGSIFMLVPTCLKTIFFSSLEKAFFLNNLALWMWLANFLCDSVKGMLGGTLRLPGGREEGVPSQATCPTLWFKRVIILLKCVLFHSSVEWRDPNA